MSAHTPGPWRISSRPAQLVSTDGQVIALAIGYDFENLLENACLIAAAPDLYEAARAVWKSSGGKGAITEYDIDAMAQLAAAIAKAEGRDP